ncbi:pyridoxamine 5'-phosphate oxidase family protein [uncultured Streptomyces sp.]|uniref:pyridoxamine 5'-phosphate oxidase family protein n=1 Tax=uncultured Streptomyces sp. TaxID=174707 RepID=UPI00263406CE|nr:pyridoxamine 5'-phosphate oxidase family protein [uncultured Streptomyces sp.]
MSPDEELAIGLLGNVPYGRLATSMRALPFLVAARHVVSGDGTVVLRLHKGFGHHESCDGSVVAYGADNLNAPCAGFGPAVPLPGGCRAREGAGLWSVQFTGTAELLRPDAAQLALFGPEPVEVNGEPFDPAYLRLRPHFVSLHTMGFDASPEIRQVA